MNAKLLFLLTFTFYLLPSPLLAADAPAPPATTQPALTPLEQQFTARLSNAVLVGHSTTNNGAPKPDRYTILSVRKLKDDNWLFQARVQFGNKDVTIPMIIPVKWAGDTPVISVTDLGFPGLGSYTARVVIAGDQYAGTWSSSGANPHGGHLWGKIEHAPTTQPATTKPAAAPPAKP
jgi:hypothetical protein